MKIGCLQFSPQVGDVDNNLSRADKILSQANPEGLDLLILPELAFSGYNFKSLHEIYPYLEPTGAGISSLWARTVALKYDCTVAVGYPEKADVSHKWPTSPEYYNSLIVVNRDGDTWAHYRKTHLYYTDESWALEGPEGFYKGYLPGVGKIALGICMDINPYKFEAPWDEFEFSTHALEVAANVLIVSMAWLTREESNTFSTRPHEPDMETLTYWVKRMEPLIRSESGDEVIVIFANRSGIEDDVVYAGTSAVIGIQNGEVTVYGILGRGEKQLLVVDTSKPAYAKMVYRPEDEAEDSVDNSGDDSLPSIPDDIDEQPDVSEPDNSRVDEDEDKNDTNIPESKNSGVTGPSDEVERTVFETYRQPVDVGHQEEVPSFNAELEDSMITSWLSSQPLPNEIVAQLRSHSVSRSGISARNLGEHHTTSETLYENQDLKSDDALTDVDSEPVTEFSSLVKAFKSPGYKRDASVTRPPPTISRDKSRSRTRAASSKQTTERAHSRSERRHQKLLQQEQETGVTSPKRSQSRHNQPVQVDDLANRDTRSRGRASPDLEKIGADLMVFEEGNGKGPKRDSLLCHVDDDDYVVLQTVRKDGRSGGHTRSASEKSNNHPSSNTPSHSTSRRHENTSHEHSRSHSRRRKPVDSYGSPRESEYRDARSGSRNRQRADSGHHTSTPRSIREMSSLSQLASAVPSPRSRQEAIKNLRADIQSHSPTRIVEHQAVVPVQHSKYRSKDGSRQVLREDSKSPSSTPVLFSPKGMADSSPSIFSPPIASPETPGTGISDLEPQRSRGFPLTPRAMVLPDDSYSSSDRPRSDSSLTKGTALASCI
ncbi:protein N-terminal amidase [Apiospora arundinis]